MYATAKDKNDTVQDLNASKDDLRTAANDAGRKVRGFINTASEEIIHAKDTVNTQIHTKPVQSSLIALGIGYVLGRYFAAELSHCGLQRAKCR